MNEVEALAKKAGRGAGQSWGLAEEAGRAVRLLSELGLDVAGAYADLLAAQDGVAYADLAPLRPDATWQAAAGRLCPLICGATLGDYADKLAGDSGVHLGAVAAPQFLIPFAMSAARKVNHPLRLNWEGVSVWVDSDSVYIDGPPAALSAPEVGSVTIAPAKDRGGQQSQPQDRAVMNDAVYTALTAFAARTYAPATEASRLAGAGAGTSDND